MYIAKFYSLCGNAPPIVFFFFLNFQKFQVSQALSSFSSFVLSRWLLHDRKCYDMIVCLVYAFEHTKFILMSVYPHIILINTNCSILYTRQEFTYINGPFSCTVHIYSYITGGGSQLH